MVGRQILQKLVVLLWNPPPVKNMFLLGVRKRDIDNAQITLKSRYKQYGIRLHSFQL